MTDSGSPVIISTTKDLKKTLRSDVLFAEPLLQSKNMQTLTSNRWNASDLSMCN